MALYELTVSNINKTHYNYFNGSMRLKNSTVRMSPTFSKYKITHDSSLQLVTMLLVIASTNAAG